MVSSRFVSIFWWAVLTTLGDATSQQESHKFTVGSDLDSQQNGVVWANPNTIVSASLSGTLNVFDIRENSTWRKLYGPTKAVTSATFEPKSQTFFTGSFDGSMKGFSADGECFDVAGGHSARISGISYDGQGKVHTAAWDDKVATIDGQKYTYVVA
jgi:WD40 repeat protein